MALWKNCKKEKGTAASQSCTEILKRTLAVKLKLITLHEMRYWFVFQMTMSAISLRLPLEETPHRRCGFLYPARAADMIPIPAQHISKDCKSLCRSCTRPWFQAACFSSSTGFSPSQPPLPATAASLIEEQSEHQTLWPWSCRLFKSVVAAWVAHREAVITTETGELSAG